MRRRAFVGCLMLAGVAACERRHSHAGELCRACQRPVHEPTSTVAMVGGKRATFCCPACAISESRQLGQEVRVISLTDFNSDNEISPESAFLVKGSDVNPCSQHAPTPASDKRPMQVAYDRCSPSLLAFASRSAAEEFARAHGGTILLWKDAATSQPPSSQP
jgi:hypothetical protein